MTDLYTEIGAKINAFLDTNNITQTQFAKQIGVSKQVMGKIIHGKKAINLVEIQKIAEVMKITVDSLIQKTNSEEKFEPVFLMMGRAQNPNTSDSFRFLNHVMDEMIALNQLLTE